jgi:tripartite-type tricarboxylate transporter receptor subunit TctC
MRDPGRQSRAAVALVTPLEADVKAALGTPAAREKLQAAGVEVTTDGATALGARIKRETQTWREVVSRAGIALQ